MKTILLLIILMPSLNTRIISQCNFIPSTSKATDTLTYKFSGGIFDSQGCVLIDPTYWLAGSEATVKVTFVNPESYPSIRVWGMNDDDTASVSINGVGYPLTYSSASYDKKVICGLSPGPDGVIFSNGKLVGANNNKIGNYSYQNIQLNLKNVSTITLSGLSGKGWGFAGISVNCTVASIQLTTKNTQTNIYPNPFTNSTTLQFNTTIFNLDFDIYNQYGKNIKTINNFSGDKITIDRNNLQSGVYLIRLSQYNKIIATYKLLITD